MAATAIPLSNVDAYAAEIDQRSFWLRNRRWDLFFITLSVIVVPLPYLMYLLGVHLGLEDDISRNLVNTFVAVAIGGPHMMSTFLRTGLDERFKERYPTLVRSSIIIPILVISLAFLNLSLMLTFFFFWASLHVLHQVTYIVELYNHKEAKVLRKSALSPLSRLIDYAIVLTSLFPIAMWKISQGVFEIGQNDLGEAIPDLFQQPDNPWFFILVSLIFGCALLAFVLKSLHEFYHGILNLPKFAFITLTVLVAFFTPLLPNLDTAFQGLNTWHSFQYLAITFYIIKIRQVAGQLDAEAPLVARFSRRTKDARALYGFSAALLVGSAVIFVLVYLLAAIVRPGIDGNSHFDIAYYTAILSFLWIHYYHDHFLFTDFEALEGAYAQ
ncbi:MAG: hypothetical protein OXI77_15630 [Chloroflexota bacterium]|nr:hypothetical protein [Chloroflexota bacterium]MDE2909419.1 hypothetical protein [Chloroflexota bacterium]